MSVTKAQRLQLIAEGKCVDCYQPRGKSYSVSRCLTCLGKRREYGRRIRGIAPNLLGRKFHIRPD